METKAARSYKVGSYNSLKSSQRCSYLRSGGEGAVKAGRGSPFTDVNKDVASVATLPLQALPASHMSCILARGGGWGPLLPFLEARTTEAAVAARAAGGAISVG